MTTSYPDSPISGATDLRSELKALRHDLSALVDTVSGIAGAETTPGITDSIQERLTAIRRRGSAVGTEMGEQASAQVRRGVATAETTIERHPLPATFLAMGIGLLLGMAAYRAFAGRSDR